MSIFNDKALKGVAAAVSKIMDEELKGNQHKIDANKNGKVDAHDFKLLRAKKTMKEEEQLQEYESKGGTYKNKGSYGTSHNADDEEEKKPKGYGARQNANKRGESIGKKVSNDYKDEDKDTGVKQSPGRITKTKTGLIHKMRESYSFTEMLQLYNEAGVEVINKIAPQTVKFGDTEVELIDANIVNGAVGITVAEEVDNETFTKEVEAQKEKNAGRGKKAEVAKASVQAVKQEEVEQMDEADVYSIKNKKTGQIYHHSKYPITKNTQKFKQIKSAGGDHVHAEIHVNGKPIKEDVEQIDEISKGTLGSYIKKASHDVAAKGAFTRHFADKSRAETAEQKHDIARKTMKKADKMQDAGMKRRANMAKAVDRLTKEDVQMDERTLTSAETKEKEKNVKGMKKSLSGFKSRYGDRAKEVMYATATKMAKKD
jgi:hypothetical protein